MLQWFSRCWSMSAAKASHFAWSSVLRNAFSLAFRIKGLLHVQLFWTSAFKRIASNGEDKSWPVTSQREKFWRWSQQERLVAESQGCHVGEAYLACWELVCEKPSSEWNNTSPKKCVLWLYWYKDWMITEKTKSDVDPNFLSTNKESRLPSTAIGSNDKGTYLTFVSVQI